MTDSMKNVEIDHGVSGKRPLKNLTLTNDNETWIQQFDTLQFYRVMYSGCASSYAHVCIKA